jgi:acetyltransferase
VGIISQSGSLTILLGQLALQKGIRFSKLVSIGNECDVNSTDVLGYLGRDSRTRVIGAYLEGIKAGPRFVKALRETAQEKPVVLWKVGATSEGRRAAASHTGALACSSEIWSGLVRQTGAVPVVGLDDWVDLLVGFSLLPASLGDRIAVVAGQAGLASAAADACHDSGLRLAQISAETRRLLSKPVSLKTTGPGNPLDLNTHGFEEPSVQVQAIRAVAEDPGVDCVLLAGMVPAGEENAAFKRILSRLSAHTNKPFLVVKPIDYHKEVNQDLNLTEIPSFDSAERAASTYARVRRYWQGKKSALKPH